MITITAAEIDAQVSAWIAANQTGKRRPGIARIAKALGYARLSVKSSVERIERAAAKAATTEPATHRAYCRNTTIECSCTEYGRDHVARLETYDNPAAAIPAAPKVDPLASVDCFGRPALVVTIASVIYAVRGVDEFGAMHVSTTPTGSVPMPSVVTGIINPGAMPTLDAAVYESGLWAFARKPKPAPAAVPTVLPGQRVRITGGRFAGIETTPSEIQASGWLKFHTNARRGYGVQVQSVAPGNWQPIPYANGLHEFAPTSGGTICVTPCLRPDGTVQPCGDPVKGAIHDPQAYAAYATELAAELAKWVAADNDEEIHVHDYTCSIPCEVPARRPVAKTAAEGLALLQSLDASIAAADAELARRDALLATEPDTSGCGEGFCRCGRVFMWGECAAGHKHTA